ncbi:NEDD4 family-interacting protein 1 [Contarinia nasturtii]|uniref:NEDD4 family-interacting protein 1 n=1 Tax=Contarinia nasturtii TaxID=265458 RepID=UPI0012D468AA|nr:NEDD4 family-interacting protein 1 [Contarinia nasturtii]XP_031618091.1 NEDD4 family-interacting protein 1 [Contarinia nasturtii]XP_031618092.1 NEDD4 family-interacting protein 1 [Contarinia nasturtii]XP_031618093.1 NEDD4 family-interacting protein 1 [Contarinia nasturtii]XP_031618094.1 NEDD4 family-interacting protein 1 [Contarinia nasturtii]
MAPQPDNIPPPKADFTAPPPYEAGDYTSTGPIEPSKLPTYEEVQLEKSLHGEPILQQAILPPSVCPPPHPNPANVTFIALSDTTDPENITSDNSLLGTDIIFVTAFLIAFIFNWIGFLMLTCFCHTIAARYGALSGFGLSLAKWTLIVKHNTDLASHENSWLWWLIMAFGFLICVRALVQYVSIKRTWRLLSASAQERLLFFY